MDRDSRHGLGLAATGTTDGSSIITFIERVKYMAQVSSGATTHEIGVVRRRATRNGFGGTTEEVAHVVREIFENVGVILEATIFGNRAGAEDLVVDDNVMCWLIE